MNHHGRRRKTEKKSKQWLKHPKAVPQKRKFGPKYSDSKSHIWNYFFENILFEHTTFLYSSTRSSGHHQSFFLISDFLAKSLKASKN